MVEHLVLFKMKPEVTHAQLQEFVQALRALKQSVPGPIELHAGENLNKERGAGYGVALAVRFPNKEALDVYGPHPAHRAFIDRYVTPWCAEVVVADFETS
jgi:hypothetical protein